MNEYLVGWVGVGGLVVVVFVVVLLLVLFVVVVLLLLVVVVNIYGRPDRKIYFLKYLRCN